MGVDLREWLAAAVLCCWLAAPGAARAEPVQSLETVGPVQVQGEIALSEDLSALWVSEHFWLVASDEGRSVQLLVRDGTDALQVGELLRLGGGEEELDLEGLAAEGNTFYAVASHSLKREKLRPGYTYERNRERLRETEAATPRDRLFRFTLDPLSGELVGKVQDLNLDKQLAKDPYLGRFRNIPNKEGGVDIEGLAVRGGRLFLGFRGPVLRGGYAPVMVLSFEQPKSYELRFLALGGLGIRSLASVSGGFLVLAGPVNELPGPYRLYFWNGEDTVPGAGQERAKLKLLAELPVPEDAAAEGLAVEEERSGSWQIVVLYDSLPGGSPTRFLLARP